MEELHRAMGTEGLVVLAVNLGEDAPGVRKFMHERGLTFPVLLDRGESYFTSEVSRSVIRGLLGER